jgi:hypothetical protein
MMAGKPNRLNHLIILLCIPQCWSDPKVLAGSGSGWDPEKIISDPDLGNYSDKTEKIWQQKCSI